MCLGSTDNVIHRLSEVHIKAIFAVVIAVDLIAEIVLDRFPAVTAHRPPCKARFSFPFVVLPLAVIVRTAHQDHRLLSGCSRAR